MAGKYYVTSDIHNLNNIHRMRSKSQPKTFSNEFNSLLSQATNIHLHSAAHHIASKERFEMDSDKVMIDPWEKGIFILIQRICHGAMK